MKKQNLNTQQVLTIKDHRGKIRRILVKDIRLTKNPILSGEYFYIYRDRILDLTIEQKQLIWKNQAPELKSYLDDEQNIWLTMEARITHQLTLEWVSDDDSEDGHYRGKLVFVQDGMRLVIADQLPEKACQNLFNSILDAYKAQGQRPVITFCSFD